MNILFRLINVTLSALITYYTFNFVYSELYSYLPGLKTLESINNASNINSVLRENSTELRDLFNNAFEKSIIYSLIVFVLSIFVLEYIRLGNIFVYLFKNIWQDIKDIKSPKPIVKFGEKD